MKPIRFLTFFFTCLVNFSLAQNKRDNTIIVHGFVSYNQLKNVLFDEGYIPSSTDTSFISTNYNPQGMLGEVSFIIKKTDSTLTLKGILNAKFGGMELKGEPLENIGERGTVYRVGFATMNKIAISFGLPVTYLRLKK